MNTLSIRKPDDCHIHLRQGAVLKRTVADASKQFGRAIVMPNLVPPVCSVNDARLYRDSILLERPTDATKSSFIPLMTLYLTDQLGADEVRLAKKSGFIHGVKLYPAGATTNSAAGVTDIWALDEVFSTMAELSMPLLVHGEVTDNHVDIFDREKVFISTLLAPLVEKYPTLKVVFEHITTAEAVDFVRDTPSTVAATITAHHLRATRNDLLIGGIKPHYYCLPVLKRREDREKLIEAATSGEASFFLGTDSAPHSRERKESACGCAGSYTAMAALPLYAEVFEDAGQLDKLEAFASLNGAAFYGLEPNAQTVTLLKQPWQIPEELPFGNESLIPFGAGSTLRWKLSES
jgi:dihydroorotase